MNTTFKDLLPQRTDEDLIKIVTVDRDGYQPSAVSEAEAEIQRRNIDPLTIESVKAELLAQLEEQERINQHKVSMSVRVGHWVVDSLAILLIDMILSYLLGYFAVKGQFMLTTSIVFLVLVSGAFGYYVLMETLYQKTIGKYIFKTRVMMKDGSKPKADDIMRRTFYRFIPFEGLSFLFMDDGLHDRLSETTVIKDESN